MLIYLGSNLVHAVYAAASDPWDFHPRAQEPKHGHSRETLALCAGADCHDRHQHTC